MFVNMFWKICVRMASGSFTANVKTPHEVFAHCFLLPRRGGKMAYIGFFHALA